MSRPKIIEWRPPARGARALLAAVACVCALLGPSIAWASISCSVSTTTHAFGAYDTLTPKSGTSAITVTCTSTDTFGHTVSYKLALSTGSGTYAGRQMTGTGDTLTYNLYTNAAHTTVWDNVTTGTCPINCSVTIPAGSSSASTTPTVFGLIGAPQNVTPGAYSTATRITVTLSGGTFTTKTTTFNTTASVAAQCNVSAATLAFGAVNPLSSQVDATTTLTVNCTKNSPYTVGLNAGVTTGTTIAQRLMANGANTMLYNLYTNAARSTIWGNSAVAPTWVSGTGAGLGTAQPLTVYGRVASGQTNLAVGNYQENTITVTVTY